MPKHILVLIAILCNTCIAVPIPYYDVDAQWSNHTLYGIKEILGIGFTKPYSNDVFDCSERSAYVEWILTNHGFDARLCMNWRGPWLNNPHSWVGVQLENEVIYIETCDPYERFVYINSSNLEWYKYNIPVDPVDPLGMHQFSNIYEAMLDGVAEDELDWWTVISS